MRHDDHRHARFSQPLHDGKHFAHEFRVKRRGRFVKEHNLGFHGKCSGNSNALLLTARKACRIGVGLVEKSDVLAEFNSTGLGCRRIFFKNELLGKHDVLNDGFVRPEIEALKNHAQVLAHVIEVGLRIGDFDAVEEDGAGGRYLKGVDAAKHRALARSRRAEHNDLFARHDVEIDAVEHDMVAEGFLQILNGYDGFGHGS